MSTRAAHRLSLFVDRDVLHSLAVASAACVLSAGRVYVGYLVHVWRIARRAPCLPVHGECVLLFGKHAPLPLEAQSRDTLQNLRNARTLLDAGTAAEGAATLAVPPRVTLLSSRYHLARCALFAQQLGFDWELCAAEPSLRFSPGNVLHIAFEAGYVCWTDLGTRWARLIGHRRMLARVT
jgi:hypothetical protein